MTIETIEALLIHIHDVQAHLVSLFLHMMSTTVIHTDTHKTVNLEFCRGSSTVVMRGCEFIPF